LKQRQVTWFATRRRAYTWIDPRDGDPYRPYIVLVVEAEQGRIRRIDIRDDLPAPQAVLASLLSAMRRPMLGSGGHYRPARIVLDDSALVDALASSLSQIDVRCTYQHTLSLVQETLDSMAATMHEQELVPGLLSVPGVTVPMVEELFTVAADFYRRTPWEWLDNKSPIEVRYPHDGQARYALVLGSGRETFGLSSYESLADIYTVYSPDTPRDPIAPVPWFSLVFEEPMAISFYDLDAIEKYHWPVAAELAYPMAMKLVRGADTFTVPTADEIAWLAAALRTIPDFITQHLHATGGFPRPGEATFGLPGIHGGRRIALRYRGDLWELAMEHDEDEEYDEQAELENFIEDWYYDDASREFARQVGQFLFDFLDDLDAQGFSDRTYNKHVGNCWLIGKFTCGYGYHETFSPQIFQGGPSYLYEFERKVSDAPSAIKSYQATWRKLARYAQKRQSQN
jgi:hypothetical protein